MSVADVVAAGERPAMPRSRTAAGLLDEQATNHSHVEFVIGAQRRYTYLEMRDAVRGFARGLHALGVRRGDSVAILMGNRPEWLIAEFAILSLGAVMVSLNTWSSRRELAYMLTHSDASVLVCTDRFLGQDYLEMLAGMHEVEGLRHVVRVAPDERELRRSLSWDRVIAMGDDVDDEVIDAARAAVDPEDVAYIIYTSGSTSAPKGVQLQHYALIENMWWIGERQRLRVGDRLWLAVSLFWALGCENALFALMTHAGTLVLQESFEAGEAIALMERERCTVIYATPNMVRAIADHPGYRRERLAALRTGVTIGTPEQIRLLAAIGAPEICNVYGSTEVYGNCAVTDAAWPLTVRASCCGEPLDGVDVVIADLETRAPLPAGQVGEILIRGYVTCGYYKDEDRNRDAFDAQGYFLSGDLGYLDEHGRLHFQGRLKELIKTGGINVAPVEVEEVLMSCPGVEQAYVVGLADAERDEVVAAIVVSAPGTVLTEECLRAHCRGELAAYKRPRRYLLLPATALPLTSTGKVHKAAMPALFASEPGA